MVGFIFVSTRRMNYILLLLNILLLLFIARRSGIVTIKQAILRSRYIILLFGMCSVVIIILVPGLLDGIWFAIQSINMYSSIGFEYTGEFRLIQIENIFLNMWNIPITFLSGFGIGTKWEVIKQLPITMDEIGSFMAYDAKTVVGGNDFLPYFHVPYFATFFRFGIIGCFTLLYIVRILWINNAILIRSLPDKNMKLLLTAFTSLIMMPILILGDSPTPVGYIMLGINLGLIESIRLSQLQQYTIMKKSQNGFK
jgi:hypothetical protein